MQVDSAERRMAPRITTRTASLDVERRARIGAVSSRRETPREHRPVPPATTWKLCNPFNLLLLDVGPNLKCVLSIRCYLGPLNLLCSLHLTTLPGDYSLRI